MSFPLSILFLLSEFFLSNLYCFFHIIIVCAKQDEGFHLDLDDFLMGLLTMCNELVSLLS